MSSIGHLVLYLVDPVSDDMTSGLEHLTKTQRDLLPNHSIFGSEVLHNQVKAIPLYDQNNSF